MIQTTIGERSSRSGTPDRSDGFASFRATAGGSNSSIVRMSCGLVGAMSMSRTGTPRTRPIVTTRFIPEKSVSPSPMPTSPSRSRDDSGMTFAAPWSVVIDSGAEPERPPCHTSSPMYPAAQING